MNTERELLKRALNYIAHRPKNESFVQLCDDIRAELNKHCVKHDYKGPTDRELIQRSLTALEKADAIYGTGFISLRVDLAKALKRPEDEYQQVGVLDSYCKSVGYHSLPNILWTGEQPAEGTRLYVRQE